jgi:hypothetical protein
MWGTLRDCFKEDLASKVANKIPNLLELREGEFSSTAEQEQGG